MRLANTRTKMCPFAYFSIQLFELFAKKRKGSQSSPIGPKWTLVSNAYSARARTCCTTLLQNVYIRFSCFQACYIKIDVSNHIAARFSSRLDPRDISQAHSFPISLVISIAPDYENKRFVRFALVCMYFSCFSARETKINMSYHIAARFSARIDPNDISTALCLRIMGAHFIVSELQNNALCTTRVWLALDIESLALDRN